MSEYHVPVLLRQAVEGLSIDPEGVYVDATFGGGGHSAKILEKIKGGRLVAFDQDIDALANVPDDERLIFVRHNFRYLPNFLDYYELGQVDGVLADLGVSSHDFDVAQRGFSFRYNGTLDMRMNRESDFTAADLVNEYSEDDLMRVLKNYGELKNARKLAAVIIKNRAEKKIETTMELREMLRKYFPRNAESKSLAKVFQALRIEVNDELGVLRDFLAGCISTIRPGGRLVVISYHSLEDRIVKNFILKGDFDGKETKDFYGNIEKPFDVFGKKVVVPDDEEIALNPRARSAKMRIAIKR